jgi:hypothetical protein
VSLPRTDAHAVSAHGTHTGEARDGPNSSPTARFEGASTSAALPAASRSARCRALSSAPRTQWIFFLSTWRAEILTELRRLFASICASSAAMSKSRVSPSSATLAPSVSKEAFFSSGQRSSRR